MFEKIKKLFASTAFNISLIVFLTCAVLTVTFHAEGTQIIPVLKKVSIPGVIGIVILMIFERLLLGWGLKYECSQTHPKYTLKQGFLNAYTAGLFCNITPGASGGQIAQGFLFRRQGIPVSHAVSILWLDFIVYQTVMTLFVLVLIILRFHYFYANYSQFFLIVLGGFAVSSAIIVFLYLLADSPKFYTWLTTSGINIGAKLHLIRDREKTIQNLNRKLQDFAREIVVLRTHRKMIVLLGLENLLRLVIYYSIPYFCALALHIPVGPERLLDIISLSSFVSMVNAFLPMPGSSGGTEATFVLMFSTIFDTVDAASIMLLWRFVTFYQTLIIGTAVYLYAKSLPPVLIDEDEITRPRTYMPQALKDEGE